METDNVSPDSEATNGPSPLSPAAKRPSRRSSAACARRLSRASGVGGGGGIPLEDLLATVPDKNEASMQDRLAKMAQLVLVSTVRGVVGGLAEDEEVGDMAKSIGAIISQTGVGKELIEKVAQRLEGGVEVGDEGVVGEQVRIVREYTEELQKEGEKWKELIVERKEMVRNAESNARAARRGEIVVGEDQRFSLSAQEKMMIKKLPSCKAALEQLKGHREKMDLISRAVTTQTVRIKRSLEQVEGELGFAARELIVRADNVGGRVVEIERGPAAWFGESEELDRVQRVRGEVV